MFTDTAKRRTVVQMRLVVEVEDYEQALHFYRDVLGLPEEAAFEGEERLASRSSRRVARHSRSPTRLRSG